MSDWRRVLCIVLLTSGLARGTVEDATGQLIGDVERSYQLNAENRRVRGIDLDDGLKHLSMFVLDASGKIFTYELPRDDVEPTQELKLVRVVDLPQDDSGQLPVQPRGLAIAREGEAAVAFFLNWDPTKTTRPSSLWRFELRTGKVSIVDLSLHRYHMGDREPLDVTCCGDQLFVSYDASSQQDQNHRVLRGIVQLRFNAKPGFGVEFVRHLPDSGRAPSRGLARMDVGDGRYLWSTCGNEQIVCATEETGQQLFNFARPETAALGSSLWGLASDGDDLWVAEDRPGADFVHRVNVSSNLDSPRVGAKVVRRLEMAITTRPLAPGEDAGEVEHNYSRPYAFEQLGNQGVWPETERVADTSSAVNVDIESLTIDPAGDSASRQHMCQVKYADTVAHEYSSHYRIDLWTSPYRKYVYPHRANRDISQLSGTNYLADDRALYNLEDRKTYDDFFQRVRAHIQCKYGVVADLENPYWAARNVVEYIQDHYYYPSLEKHIPATVDYDREHYDANPGNLKIELSSRPYDQSQIIACSGTSVMVAGAMRYLGIPARWLGTGTQKPAGAWDDNHNGLLDEDEVAPCTNGHRYTQVWLGSNYGWICFDATPKKPPRNDYDAPPPLQTQWRYMERAAAGHREEKRIVFNVGSGVNRLLYRDFLFDEQLAKNNNCGGDQRYNLQGRFEFPEKWQRPSHRIRVKNLCFIRQIQLNGPSDQTQISWQCEGAWARDPEATVSIFVEKLNPQNQPIEARVSVAQGIPYSAGTVTANLWQVHESKFRVLIVKDGDAETGGYSQPVDFDQIFDFATATQDVPTPREVWPSVQQYMVPPDFRVISEETVASQTNPAQQLRKVTAHFYSQKLAGKRWGHSCVIFMPADNSINQAPDRKGKVVIVSSPSGDYFPIHVDKLGDPIATRTGYPTMVLENPGIYDDGSFVEHDIRILNTLRRETGHNFFNMNCQLAVVYVQAMDAFQQFLGCQELQAVLGGHSKRGRSATVAAAVDSRVASPIIMGNEGVYATDHVPWHLSFHHAFFQDEVNVPVLYLGATNEDGYRMFNVGILQERLKQPMTVEMIPNYCHSNFSEIQYMDFLMWVAHIFDDRPITRIEDVTHERKDGRTFFRAKITSEARVQMVRAWYVFSDDPAWRDLMWYHLLMRKQGDYYETSLHGKVPDAFMIEVGDIAQGIPGYVSSVPFKLTDAPVVERRSRGSFPRLWDPRGN
jgi:hypothetical protein